MTLPAHIELALREIGVVAPAKALPPPTPRYPTGRWFPDGDIPF